MTSSPPPIFKSPRGGYVRTLNFFTNRECESCLFWGCNRISVIVFSVSSLRNHAKSIQICAIIKQRSVNSAGDENVSPQTRSFLPFSHLMLFARSCCEWCVHAFLKGFKSTITDLRLQALEAYCELSENTSLKHETRRPAKCTRSIAQCLKNWQYSIGCL